MTKLSIIIPVWNEEGTLQQLVEEVLSIKFPPQTVTELLIINDASSDNSGAVAQRLAASHRNIKVFNNQKNLGKSRTVKKGLLKSTGDVVVIQDADLEYDPNELASMLKLMQRRDLDVVYGNRFGRKNKVIYWQNYIGNRSLSFISSLFTYPRIRTWIPDMEVCHKMIRGDVARVLAVRLVSVSGFGLEPEITARLSRYKIDGRHLKFGIMATTYQARTMEQGKKMHAFRDGIKALKEILWFNLGPL